MMSFLKLCLLLSLLLPPSLATAHSDVRVYRDSAGMPRCIERSDNANSGVLLRWDTSSRYVSSVDAILIKSMVGIPTRLAIPVPQCRHWPKLLWSIGIKTGINPKTTEVFGVRVPPSVREAIAQIQRGGTVYHSEKTGREFLKNHPIPRYTRALNEELTRKYGVGFASEIYAAFVRSQEPNRKFQSAVYQRINQAYSSPNRALSELGNLMAGIKVLMVSGLGQSPEKVQGHLSVNLRDFLDDLQAMGLDWEIVDNHPNKQMDANIPRIEAHIERILASGKKLIVIGQSKGTPEAFQAIGNLERKWSHSGKRPQGKIVGFINLSGVVTGSWVADYTDSTWFFPWIRNLLSEKESEKAQEIYERLSAFHDLSSLECLKRLRSYGPWLPKETSYINLIGTVPGNGLAQEENGVDASPLVNKIQNLFGKYLVKKFGANDGYVEYPGTVLPSWVGVDQRSLVFDASHYIFDGKLGRWKMTVTDERRKILTGLFLGILDLRWGKIQ